MALVFTKALFEMGPTFSPKKLYCKKQFHLYHSRADTKRETNEVPHGALPEIADGSSLMERPAAEDCSAKSPPSDWGQPLPASSASAQSSHGATDDADESTMLLGDDS